MICGRSHIDASCTGLRRNPSYLQIVCTCRKTGLAGKSICASLDVAQNDFKKRQKTKTSQCLQRLPNVRAKSGGRERLSIKNIGDQPYNIPMVITSLVNLGSALGAFWGLLPDPLTPGCSSVRLQTLLSPKTCLDKCYTNKIALSMQQIAPWSVLKEDIVSDLVRAIPGLGRLR